MLGTYPVRPSRTYFSIYFEIVLSSLFTILKYAIRRRKKRPIFASEHTKKSAAYFSYEEPLIHIVRGCVTDARPSPLADFSAGTWTL